MLTIEQARAYYAAADPVHDFDHILRVLALVDRIGQVEGADMEILRTATLLHDASGATPGETSRQEHHLASAALADTLLQAAGWPTARREAVLHCIRAHRFRGTEAPQTLEAKILYDCDKLDVLGAIGVARTVAYAALAGEPLTGEPSAQFKATRQKEPGEPHTPYHEFLFKLSRVKDQLYLASTRAVAEARHQYLAEYFERLAREVRGEA